MNASPASPDYSQKWMVLLTVAVGVILSTIDASIVNVALPTLVEELNTTFPVIQWVTLGYLLTLASLTLGVGRLGDVVGKKRLYSLGFVLFTAASTACGLAPNVGALIGFRVVQALGAVAVLALGVSILTEAFPPQERGRALGFVGTAVSVGVITGPVAGGLIISALDWRWIFLVNLPVGLVGTLLAFRYVPDTPPLGRQRFDLPGAGLMSLTLLAVALALTLGQELGFSSPPILALFALGVVGGAVFLRVERRVPSPMVDLTLFRNPLLTVSIVTGFLTFLAVGGIFFLMPFYLENVLGLSVRDVGLVLGTAPLVLGLVAPASGALSDRVGVRWLTLAGLVVLVGTYLAFGLIDTDTPVWVIVAVSAPLGVGMGVFQSPNNSAIMGSVPREYSGVAGGMLTLTRLLGQISGVAVLGSVWSARVLSAGAVDATRAPAELQVAGLRDVFHLAAALLLVAAALGGWGLHRERSAPRPLPQEA